MNKKYIVTFSNCHRPEMDEEDNVLEFSTIIGAEEHIKQNALECVKSNGEIVGDDYFDQYTILEVKKVIQPSIKFDILISLKTEKQT